MWDKKHDANLIVRNDIPLDIGIYTWYTKSNEELIYIGKAMGKGGLYTINRLTWKKLI
jgi:hypothetical protein